MTQYILAFDYDFFPPRKNELYHYAVDTSSFDRWAKKNRVKTAPYLDTGHVVYTLIEVDGGLEAFFLLSEWRDNIVSSDDSVRKWMRIEEFLADRDIILAAEERKTGEESSWNYYSYDIFENEDETMKRPWEVMIDDEDIMAAIVYLEGTN